jgi:hypothetical protein
MRVRDAVRFPPVAMFLAILILGIIVNIYASVTPSESHQEKLFMLNPTAVLTEKNVTKPSRFSVMVLTGAEGDYAGWYAAVIVYGPHGDVYAVREGRIDKSGAATIDVWIGRNAAVGNYTLLPVVGFDSLHTVIGKPVFFTVNEIPEEV